MGRFFTMSPGKAAFSAFSLCPMPAFCSSLLNLNNRVSAPIFTAESGFLLNHDREEGIASKATLFIHTPNLAIGLFTTHMNALAPFR